VVEAEGVQDGKPAHGKRTSPLRLPQIRARDAREAKHQSASCLPQMREAQQQRAPRPLGGGEGAGIPLPLPHNSLSYTLVSNNISDKPIPVSFPAEQFEHFERAIQEVNTSSGDVVI